MAILTEDGNEYEVQIVNAVTGQSFQEYAMLGDQEKFTGRECKRYITAYPGIMFNIQITLKTDFCFKQFDAVEANLYFQGQTTYYGLAVLSDPNPDHTRTKQDLRMEIGCVNMSNYGQTDVIGVNPVDLGSFFVTLDRRRIAPSPNNYHSKDATTAFWNAEKVDKSSFKEQGIMNSIGSRRELSSRFMPRHRGLKNGLLGMICDHQREKLCFWACGWHCPAICPSSRLAKIKRKAQGPPNAIKQEMKPSNKAFTRNSNSKITGKHKVNEGHFDLDHIDLSSAEPLAKRQKIMQKPIDVNAINNYKIRQGPTNFEALDENAMIISKETAINYDLMELIDAVVLLERSTPSTKPEDSVYWEIAKEVLRQTADEFVRSRG
ncbi:hypothetical protein BHYA_0044g00360 [Botrytis hyacinthi]|uniref:DUF7918 domain-containing protein n=1 Tax=Botrytis hyacinthi TaxID=278943 RepID=A0A4Z1GSY4_9HELO|nr:hypothetical protein BHYA_0044g00360 [Botrytis hyacinthi]